MTKEFTISINGVTQSVSAVDALLAKLDALDDKINSLSDVDTADLKNSLQDIRKELETNAENWEDISDRIEDASNEVNRLERAYKALDNPLKPDDVREFNKEIKSVEKSLNDIEDNDIKIDSRDIGMAAAKAADLATNLQKVQRAEDQLGTKLNINIGGLALEFDDVNQAIGVLEDKLYQLANSGQRNTQQFKDITAQIVNLRTAVKQVDNELDNAFSGGLNKAIQGVQGLTAIGSVASGIGGLFGVEELDESIQKFAQLSLILQGLKEIQEQLRDSTSYLAKVFKFFGDSADVVIKGFNAVYKGMASLAKGIDTLAGNAFTKFGKTLDTLTTKWQALDKFTPFKTLFESQDRIDKTNQLYKELSQLIVDLNVAASKVDFNKLITPNVVTSIGRYGIGIDNVINKLTRLRKSGEIEISDEEFSKAVEMLKNFDNNIDPTIKDLGKLREELGALGVPFKLLNSIDFDGKLNIWQKGLIGLVNGCKAFSAALKAVRTVVASFARTTLIFTAMQIAIEAITWAVDKLIGAFRSLMGWDLEDMVNGFEDAQSAIEATNKSVDKYKKELQNLVDNKVISNQTRLNNTIDEYNRQLIIAIKNLQDLKKTGVGIENMDSFIEEFEVLQKAVQGGTDKIKAMSEQSTKWYEVWKGQYWSEVWNTAGDAASEYASLQKKVIDDIQYRINNLDISKGEEEIKKFIDLLDTPIYQISLANVENLFPEDEYAKVLAANIKQIRDYYDEIQNLQKEAEENAQALQDQITDNNIAGIQNRFERERAELENNYQRELRDAENNEELKLSIQNKYNAQRQSLLKSQADEARNIQNQINSNEIAAMQDGLAKRLAELEQSRKQELDAARDSQIKVGEQEAAINKKYDAQILQVKTEFYNQRIKLLEDYTEQYRQLWNQIVQMEYDFAESRITNRYEDKARELGYTDDSIENIREYYDKIRDIANENAEKLAEIDKERVLHDRGDSLEAEKKRNKDRLAVIEENYKDGLLTKEEYDKAIQDETDVHYKMMDTITRDGEQKLVDIQRDYEETARNNNATAITERINALREAYDGIEGEYKVSSIGVIDYGATKRSLEQAKEEYNKLFEYISQEWDKLLKAFEEKKISFGDFTNAKKELQNLAEETQKAQNENKNNLDSLLSDTIESVATLVSSYLGVLGGMWSTYNDIQMMRIEQEQARLDEEYDMLEEAYERQEELTQKHTDKLNDIEDELKTSRGDRRAHLVEQLNAERAAMLASLQEEQKIEKQKEINQKKQDALEKKRREQEKKNSIVQATINTFTAVTNALAVQPWFVGLALSAVALALGMAQVANIKKQKYASGGLLIGKSHSLGGIPVGNTGIEVEGNEYVVNKKSTSKNLPLIDYINTQNRTLSKDDLIKWFDSGKRNVTSQISNKYATGGVIPNIPTQNNEQTIVIQDDRPIVAEIVDIVNRADNYRQIQILSGLN